MLFFLVTWEVDSYNLSLIWRKNTPFFGWDLTVVCWEINLSDKFNKLPQYLWIRAKKQLLWNMSLIICGNVFIRWWIYIQYYIICLCFLITQSKMNQVWLTTACEQHVNWYLILCYVTFKFNFSVHGRTAVKVHWKYTTTTTISTLYDNIEYHIYLPNA